MYKKGSIIVAFLGIVMMAHSKLLAQKIGYIDSGAILERMPEYKNTKGALDKLAQEWQKEVDKLQADVDEAYRNYKTEELLLTERMKAEKLKDVEKKKQLAHDTQKKYFGYEGLLFLKRQELIKPIQDKVFEAVEKVCKSKRLDIMFDKNADIVMIYTNPVHDYTDYVLEELGLTVENNDLNNTIKKNNK